MHKSLRIGKEKLLDKNMQVEGDLVCIVNLEVDFEKQIKQILCSLKEEE